MSSEAYGRRPISKSRNPFTCGLTGKTYTVTEAFQRREFLARALSKIMGWAPNDGTPWEKVVGVFSVNHVSGSGTSARESLCYRLPLLTYSAQPTDRLSVSAALHTPTLRNCDAGQCRVFGRRAGASAQDVWSEGTIHLCRGIGRCIEGGEGKRHPREQGVHYRSSRPQNAKGVQDGG
jgi:hypothetical protein